jgi:beta-glucosidase
VDGDASPQFVFGFGLSYTTFKYDHLIVTPPMAGSSDDVLVSFDLKNTGNREADEVAQVYVRQTTASVATPVKELKGFSRVHLQPGETQHVTLRVRKTDLAVWGAAQEWKTEPGEYTVVVGGSSAGDLSARFKIGQPDVTRTLLPDKNQRWCTALKIYYSADSIHETFQNQICK